MPEFGLIGKDIEYSFSKRYFTSKFENLMLEFSYENFDLEDISKFPEILKNHPELKGLNVTIPYKQKIIPFLDALDENAREIGAVNTIKIDSNRELIGYNTDWQGFRESLLPLLEPHHHSALILGTGGASKAIAFALNSLDIHFEYVSRKAKNGVKYLYSDLSKAIIASFPIIINCTPIGTFPNVNACPAIRYDGISKNHLLYDLVYNPPQSRFLQHGQELGAKTSNGFEMLRLQAEKSWDIWQTS